MVAGRRGRRGVRGANNKLLSRGGGSTEVHRDVDSPIETIEMRKPLWGPKTVFDSVTGKSMFVHSAKEEKECLDSGEYVESPSQVGVHNADDYAELVKEEMIFAGMEVEVPEEVVEKHRELVNYAEKIQLTKPQQPKKKYLTMMNRNELFAEGKRWGLLFNQEDPPTKLDMVHSIKLAMKDQKGIPLR